MKKLRTSLDWFISPVLYVFQAIFFPYLIHELIYNIRIYLDCVKFISNKIKNSERFKSFLDNHEFREDWVGRLYSIQSINRALADNLSDDDLQEHVMVKLSENHDFLINQGLIEVMIMKTKRLNKYKFLLILEIGNFNSILSIIYHMGVSLLVWSFILRFVYVFHYDTIIQLFNSLKTFLYIFFK